MMFPSNSRFCKLANEMDATQICPHALSYESPLSLRPAAIIMLDRSGYKIRFI